MKTLATLKMTSSIVVLGLAACGGEYDPALDDVETTEFAAVVAPGWSAEVVSITGLPDVVAPGSSHTIVVTLRNNGNISWTPSDRLVSRTLPRSLWGWTTARVEGAVDPGETFTFRLSLTAPLAGGQQTFLATMHHDDELLVRQGLFGNSGPNSTAGDMTPLVSLTTTVDTARAPALSAELVDLTLRSSMTAGDTFPAQVTLRNTGSIAWDANFALVSRTNPRSLFGWTIVRPTVRVEPGQTHTFSFVVVAPDAPGLYIFSATMARFTPGAEALFGRNGPTDLSPLAQRFVTVDP